MAEKLQPSARQREESGESASLARGRGKGNQYHRLMVIVFFCSPHSGSHREKNEDTSGEDNDEKEAVASKGRKTANSQGRRKGRITRSMASEANSEEVVAPQQNAELGMEQLPLWHGGRRWHLGRQSEACN